MLKHMSNQSYLSVWSKDFSEERMLGEFLKFLETVPYSSTRPGFSYLVIRAVSAAETPLLEHDLRRTPLNAEGVIELAREGLHSDSAFDVQCFCDLWIYDRTGEKWTRQPRAPWRSLALDPITMMGSGKKTDISWRILASNTCLRGTRGCWASVRFYRPRRRALRKRAFWRGAGLARKFADLPGEDTRKYPSLRLGGAD